MAYSCFSNSTKSLTLTLALTLALALTKRFDMEWCREALRVLFGLEAMLLRDEGRVRIGTRAMPAPARPAKLPAAAALGRSVSSGPRRGADWDAELRCVS